MRMNLILTFITGWLLLSACSSSRTVSCSISEYAVYHYNNSQNTSCAKKYSDEDKLYGFGEMNGPEGQDQMLKRVATSKAIAEIGQKAAGIQNRIKGSIGEVIEENEEGNSSVKTWFQTEFEVQLNNVEEVGNICEAGSRGYVCYSLMMMPKSALLESASATLQEENEDLYQQWVSSDVYKQLLAELR